MDAPQQTHESGPVQIRLTGNIAQQLAAIARRENNSISAVSRRLLVAALQQEQARVA